ncbi:MAG: protein-disulfide reductase DsbD family protein [Myxococcota bacterium]
MSFARVAALVVLAGLALPGVASAEAPTPAGVSKVKKPRVEVELVSDVKAVVPGESVRVALRFETDDQWHLYWKNPGAIGLPTEVTFEAPDGWDFGGIAFPLPRRIVSKIGDVSFGYEGELVLMSDVRVPEGALEGSEVTLTAKAKWLICKENCIQGTADLSLPMKVANAPRAERENGEIVKLLDDWKAKIPLAAADPRAPKLIASAETPPAKPGEPFALKVVMTAPGGAALALGGEPKWSFLPATPEGLDVAGVEPIADAAPGAPPGQLTVRLRGTAGPLATPLVSRLDGVFQVVVGGQPLAFDATLEVPRAEGPAVMPKLGEAVTPAHEGPALTAAAGVGSVCDDVGSGGAAEAEAPLSSLLLALLFAFVGGIILNAMPCVLPVLSLKIMSLVEQSQEENKVIWRHGLVYTAGVMLTFLGMGAILIAAQAAGWAAQMQSPVFVAVFVAILFGFALSLFGVFELALPFANQMDGAVARSHGYRSSFFYGMFAVLLGTPCTAPFLGPALAYAFTQPPAVLMLLLATVGFGLAFPFLVLAAFPAWRKLVPRPGPWLLTFKKVMGFLLVGTAVFFLNTLAGQLSRGAFVGYLEFLAVLAFGLFIYGHWTSPERKTSTRIVAIVVSAAVVVAGVVGFFSTEPPPPAAGTRVEGGITWHEFDLLDVEREAQDGKTVFIDFTADWCVTCKANEATAIYTDTVRRAFSELKILPVKGDFTVHKETIAKWLARFNQPSVPLYVVIPAGHPEAAFALPTLVSTDDIVGGLCKAGASKVTTAAR